MPILCKPAISVPENIITLEDTLGLCREIHSAHPDLPLALRLVKNTGVKKRHILRPIADTLEHPGFEERNRIYEQEAKRRVPAVVRDALANARLAARDIDLIVYVSCTGFMMPSLTSYLINTMDFSFSTKQIPIAQMGCAGGGAAINRAFEFCKAFPEANVLIVACEFCSLCYQPNDLAVGNLLANGLFGDAIGAAVVRGKGGCGMDIESSASYLIPGTEDWISYAVKETGFHFRLDRRVPGTMEPIAPVLRAFSASRGLDAANLDFYVIHAGGPRILSDLSRFLVVDSRKFAFSRATLEEYGNVASVVVLDAFRRAFDSGTLKEGQKGMIAGFGPGITAEICLGTFRTAEVRPVKVRRKEVALAR
jgi:1,3,6,8-tetrahydroxynaphthalene synthase